MSWQESWHIFLANAGWLSALWSLKDGIANAHTAEVDLGLWLAGSFWQMLAWRHSRKSYIDLGAAERSGMALALLLSTRKDVNVLASVGISK